MSSTTTADTITTGAGGQGLKGCVNKIKGRRRLLTLLVKVVSNDDKVVYKSTANGRASHDDEFGYLTMTITLGKLTKDDLILRK